jgi:hypothetical protein
VSGVKIACSWVAAVAVMAVKIAMFGIMDQRLYQKKGDPSIDVGTILPIRQYFLKGLAQCLRIDVAFHAPVSGTARP